MCLRFLRIMSANNIAYQYMFCGLCIHKLIRPHFFNMAESKKDKKLLYSNNIPSLLGKLKCLIVAKIKTNPPSGKKRSKAVVYSERHVSPSTRVKALLSNSFKENQQNAFELYYR